MKYVVSSDEGSEWFTVSAEPVDTDAFPPIPEARIHWPLSKPQTDRLALGCALIFEHWATGAMTVEEPISALTAQRLTEWAQSRGQWISVTNIHTAGLPIPRGVQQVNLSSDGISKSRKQKSLFFAAPSEGTSTSRNGYRVSGNIPFLMNLVKDSSSFYLVRLGAAVILAESLDVNVFVDEEFKREFPQEFSAARRLLECVALGLEG